MVCVGYWALVVGLRAGGCWAKVVVRMLCICGGVGAGHSGSKGCWGGLRGTAWTHPHREGAHWQHRAGRASVRLATASL